MLKKLRNPIIILLTITIVRSSIDNLSSSVKSSLISFEHESVCEKSAGGPACTIKEVHHQSTAPEGEKGFNLKDILQLQEALYESSKYMSKEVKHEDAVICIGATRAGKSTLINYLIGNELVAERLAKGRPITIRKIEEESIGPEIGGGSTSKTTIPTRWISKKLSNVVIWDSPGFDDNRGSVQDITNAFYVYQLLQRLKSLRVVLIVDINDILNDNIKPFVSVLNSVESLLGYKDRTDLSSLSVTFTKVPETWNDASVDLDLISDILSEAFLSSNMSLSQASKDIVEFLIKNNDHISFFKRAKLGNIIPAIDENIISAITESSSLKKDTLKKVRPSVSDISQIFLFKARNFLLPVKVFNDLEKVLSSVIDRKVQDFETYINEEKENEIKAYISQLNGIIQLFNAIANEFDFARKINIIQSIDPDVKNIIEEQNLLEKVHLMVFVDKLLDLEESNLLDLNLQGIISSSRSKIMEAMNSAQLKLGKITQQKYNEFMKEQQKRHKEETDRLRMELEETRKRNSSKMDWFEKLISVISRLFGN